MESKPEPIVNPNFTADLQYVIGSCRFLLRLTGSWPYDYIQKWTPRYFLAIILHFVAVVILIALIVPILIGVIIDETTPTQYWLLNITFIVYFSSGLIKIIAFNITKYKFIPLMEQVISDWKMLDPKHRPIMFQSINKARYILYAYCCSVYSGVVCWNFAGLTAGVSIINNKTSYPLTFSGDLIFIDIHNPPYYALFAAIQFIGCFYCLTALLNTSTISVMMVTHACGEYRVLNHEIETTDITVENQRAYMKSYFPRFVKKHVQLIRYFPRKNPHLEMESKWNRIF